MNLSFGEAVAIAGVGICFVFAVLILLLIIVKIFSSIFAGVKKTEKVEAPAPAAPAAAAAPALAKGSCGDFKLNDVEPRDAAMVMAIVADKMQTPLNELRFKSIKKVEGDKE